MKIFKTVYCIVDNVSDISTRIDFYRANDVDKAVFYHLFHHCSLPAENDYAYIGKFTHYYFTGDYTNVSHADIYVSRIENNGETHFWSFDQQALESFTCGKIEINEVTL